MSESSSQQECLETAARVPIRCFIISYFLLIIWFLLLVCAPVRDWMFLRQARWFNITREHFELINYSAMAAMKILNIVGFLIPYISIRLVLRQKK